MIGSLKSFEQRFINFGVLRSLVIDHCARRRHHERVPVDPYRYFLRIFNRIVFVPDTQRVPGGTPGWRVHAPAPRDTTATHFRVRLAGLSKAVVIAHTEQLLRPRRVPHPQGRRAHVHLLPVQWVHGSGTERNGRRHFGYVGFAFYGRRWHVDAVFRVDYDILLLWVCVLGWSYFAHEHQKQNLFAYKSTTRLGIVFTLKRINGLRVVWQLEICTDSTP